MTTRAQQLHDSSRRGRAPWSGLAGMAVVALVATSLAWLAPEAAGADVMTGTNATAIAVPAGGTTQGVASPYPSPITISGMTSEMKTSVE